MSRVELTYRPTRLAAAAAVSLAAIAATLFTLAMAGLTKALRCAGPGSSSAEAKGRLLDGKTDSTKAVHGIDAHDRSVHFRRSEAPAEPICSTAVGIAESLSVPELQK